MHRRNFQVSKFAAKDRDKVLTIIKELLLNPALMLQSLKRKKPSLVQLEQKRNQDQ
jgi:uncharacterized protein YqhQ